MGCDYYTTTSLVFEFLRCDSTSQEQPISPVPSHRSRDLETATVQRHTIKQYLFGDDDLTERMDNATCTTVLYADGRWVQPNQWAQRLANTMKQSGRTVVRVLEERRAYNSLWKLHVPRLSKSKSES